MRMKKRSRRAAPTDTPAALPARTFDTRATNACKGVALLLMLWHHLFANNPDYGPLVRSSALAAKVCVSMFLVLSGYGLAESVRCRGAYLLSFYRSHLSRLYLNYWLVAAIFVPFGVFVMHYTIEEAFSSHAYAMFALQMAGLNLWFSPETGYNATWWYMCVIVPLYVAFPILYRLTRRLGPWVFAACLCAVIAIPYRELLTGAHFSLLFIMWGTPFVFGMYLSHADGMERLGRFLRGMGALRFYVLALAIGALALFRQLGLLMHDVKIDWLLATLIILLTAECAAASLPVRAVLEYLGSHLFNIFLFHTFIYLYFWHDELYALRNPLLIWAALLASSLAISVLLEGFKKVIRFRRLEEIIARIPAGERFAIELPQPHSP